MNQRPPTRNTAASRALIKVPQPLFPFDKDSFGFADWAETKIKCAGKYTSWQFVLVQQRPEIVTGFF